MDEMEIDMRSLSRLLADTFRNRSAVRIEVTSRGHHFHVSAWPCSTFADACCPGMRRVRKVDRLRPRMEHYKEQLYGMRENQLPAVQKSDLAKAMPQVVAYVSSLNIRRSLVRETREFVVHL